MPHWLETIGLLGLILAMGAGLVYGFRWLTASATRRYHEATRQAFYRGMAARGQAIALPRTWASEGLEGHVRRTRDALGSALQWAFLLTAAVFAVAAAFRDPLDGWMLALEAALGTAVFAGLYFGLQLYETRRVRNILARAGLHAPRTAFKVVANPHGLFVPIEGRVLEGAWSVWSVIDADVISSKGGTACLGLTVALKDEPDVRVPLVASMFDDGDRLLEVIAARAERAF